MIKKMTMEPRVYEREPFILQIFHDKVSDEVDMAVSPNALNSGTREAEIFVLTCEILKEAALCMEILTCKTTFHNFGH